MISCYYGKLSAVCMLALLSFSSFAQTSIPDNNPVTQNFNSMGATSTAALPTNWRMSSAGTGANSNWNTSTNVSATSQAANSGSPSAGGRYNWGTTGGIDRAIGFQTSSGYAAPNAILAYYKNTTGAALQNLSISFDVERYRTNSTAASVTFWTSLDGTNWTAQTQGDIAASNFPTGASAYNFSAPLTINRSFILYNFALPNDGELYLRWIFTTGSSNSQGLGLDDVSLSSVTATYYPLTSATDLSQPNQWTTNAAGSAATAPVDFLSPNQIFNINNNVQSLVVNNPWAISGGSKLVLNNSAPLVFTTSAGLTIGTGSTADFNNKPVTFKSGSTGTAFIGNTTGTITNATNITVERYISSLNNRAYRLLAPSVSTTTSIYNNWQESGSAPVGYGTHITGSTTGANGFDATQTGNPSLYLYNATTPAWQAIANTNATNLSALTGYLTFIRGDRTVNLNATSTPLPTTNTVLRATGTLLTGTAGFTYPATNAFQLITNPYPSAINWVSVAAQSVGIEPYYTFWNPNMGSRGGYVTVNANGNVSPVTSAGSVIIPSGVAFFVKGKGTSPLNVEIKEEHKTTASAGDVFRVGSQTETFGASLFYTTALGQRIAADGVLAVYSNDYSVDNDEGDATQIANWDEDVAINRNGIELSIESRPLIDAADTLHISVARLKAQSYEWQFDAASFNHPGLQAVLVDNFLAIRTPLSLTGQTVVPFTVTANSASAAVNRFMVVFENSTVLPVRFMSVLARQNNKDVLVRWNVANDADVKEYTVEKSLDGRGFTNVSTIAARFAPGMVEYYWLDAQPTAAKHYYRIKASTHGGEIVYSSIISVDLNTKAAPVTLFPNPLFHNELSLNLNLQSGNYSLTLLNATGQIVYKQQLVHTGGAAAQSITLPQTIAPGIYQLMVSSTQAVYTQPLIKN